MYLGKYLPLIPSAVLSRLYCVTKLNVSSIANYTGPPIENDLTCSLYPMGTLVACRVVGALERGVSTGKSFPQIDQP